MFTKEVNTFLSFSVFLWLDFGTQTKAWEVSSRLNGDNQCAEIFIRPSYRGPHFVVKDDEQYFDISDLAYHLRKREESKNGEETLQNATESTWSFRVRDGCILKFSAATYLKGLVKEFPASVEALQMSPKSVACECPKICKCEDHKLRRSECARAYLNEDCTHCKAPFTTLKAGNEDWNSFPKKWSSGVSSIVLRQGCTATLTMSGVMDDVALDSTRVKMDIQALGNISRYRCTCIGNNEENEIPVELNENYPKLIDIPKTRGSLYSRLSTEELQRHPGLIAALQSMRSRRSSRNAYILLLGLTGSGKSSAVNLLFDHPNITKAGDYLSTTTDILQFSIPVPVPGLGMKNSALHVIDTPGIGDTRGFSQDARYLATLEEFLSTHEDLKRNKPNVVLIFSKFSDNRFRGEGSRFVKMLRTIDLFKNKIIDRDSTNVIFVLTHYMSAEKVLTRDPRERIQSIREVIEEFSSLPRPINIVLAENKPEDLESVNGFWKLPNGEFYPKNLFDQMQRNLINSEDPIGEAIIRTAFSNSDNFKVTNRRYPLLHPSNAKVTKYLGVLASLTKPVSSTEVAIALSRAYESLDLETKAQYPDVLNTLQRTLYKSNMLRISDLPQTSEETLKLFENIPVNRMTLSLLEKAFNITIPEFKKDFVVGSGYSLVQDTTLPSKIFEVGQAENIPSDIIFRFPDSYQVAVSRRLDTQIHVYANKDDFISGRMKALGLSENTFPKNSYNAGLKDHPGFNVVSLGNGDNETDWNSLTATVDYHTFQIRLTSNAKFCADFLQTIENLEAFNATDYFNVQKWQNFFDIYGTHVVVQAFGGGSIQVKAEIDNVTQFTMLTNSQRFAILSETLQNITQQLANELIKKNAAYEPPSGIEYGFTQVGGNHKHFWSNFSETDETRNIEDWRESLRYKPTVLKSRLYLVPISEVVKELGKNEELSLAIEEAASQLLNASLVYVPVGRIANRNPDSRDNLEGMRGGGDFESMQRFADMFQMISVANKDMQNQMIAFMQESQARRDADERKYQEQLLKMKAEDAERERLQREDDRHREEMELKRQQIAYERQVQERAIQMKNERDMHEAALKQRAAMEQIQSQNQQMVLQFIIEKNKEDAERERLQMEDDRQRAILASKNRQIENERLAQEQAHQQQLERDRLDAELKEKALVEQRLANERALQAQIERDRLEAEMKEKARLEEIERRSHELMLASIEAENERKNKIMIAEMNRKSGFEKVADGIGSVVRSIGSFIPFFGR